MKAVRDVDRGKSKVSTTRFNAKTVRKIPPITFFHGSAKVIPSAAKREANAVGQRNTILGQERITIFSISPPVAIE
jgi:hypothetical protein